MSISCEGPERGQPHEDGPSETTSPSRGKWFVIARTGINRSIGSANPPRRRDRRWRILGLFLLSSVLLALITVEGVGRLIFRRYANNRSYFKMLDDRIMNLFPIPGPANRDAKFGEVLRPNSSHRFKSAEYDFTAHTNSMGFRTREPEPKLPDEWRILMVGDSLCFGWTEQENTIAVQLEQIAARADISRKKLKVYNFGIPGYTTVQELLVARTYASRLQADHLIVCFFTGNDVIPNAIQYIDGQGRVAISESMILRIQSDIRGRVGLLRHSLIFRLLSISPYATRMLYDIACEPYILDKTQATLDQLKDFCTQCGLSLTLVVLYPNYGVRGGVHLALTRSRTVGRKVAAYARHQGIDVIDMLDYVEGADDARSFYYQNDIHPNAAGNHRFAEVIFVHSAEDKLR